MKSIILIAITMIAFQSFGGQLACVAQNTAPSVLRIQANIIGDIMLQSLEVIFTSNLGTVQLAKTANVIKDTNFNSKTFKGYSRYAFLSIDRTSTYSLILPKEYSRPSISAFIAYFFNDTYPNRSLDTLVCKHQ